MATFEQMLAHANEKTATIMDNKGLRKEAENLRLESKDILGDIDKRRLNLSPQDCKSIDFLDAERAQFEHLLTTRLSHEDAEKIQAKLNATIEKISGILSKYN